MITVEPAIKVVLLWLLGVNTVVGLTSNITMSTILNQIFEDYDEKLPPNYDKIGSDKQVEVVVDIVVNSMFSISEANMDYSMSMFLRERWVDERLRYTDMLNLTRLELDTPRFVSVWKPDIYIKNEKESNFHEVTVPNKMVHIYPDGTVQYSARVTGIFSCLMQLQKYPFDTQACHLNLESYGHSTENMKFNWSHDAVSVASDIYFPQFVLTSINHYKCDKDYHGIVFPCIGVTFVLERNYAYYIIQIYVPSILIVILSWVSFWLDCTAVPARISLGLLTVLTMTTQSSGARADLQNVSYVKAIDIYLAMCITFVFLGLIEFAYVNVLTRVESRRPKDNIPEMKHVNGNATGELIETENVSISKQPERDAIGCLCLKRLSNLGRARLVDKISRFLFPVMFGIFNIVYWCFYFVLD